MKGIAMKEGLPPALRAPLPGTVHQNPIQALQALAIYIVKDILGIDPVIIVNLSIFLAACSAVGRYVSGSLYYRVRGWCFSSVTINEEDMLYRYLSGWMTDHHLQNKSFRSVTASTVQKSSIEDEEAAMESMQSELDQKKDGLISYRTMISRSPIKFNPYQTTHTFLHKRNLFVFTHRLRSMPSLRRNMAMGYSGQLSLECFGRSLDPIKALLEEAQTHYLQKSFTTTTIYRANGPGWLPVVSRPSRAIDSVILEPEKKQALLTDMNEYLHPRTRRWYANRGIPYRRGYLFSGPPGTGKTSLSAALAGVFGVDIYVLSLLDPYINEDSLQRLFSSVPSRCIMLLEDVDAAGLNRANDPKLSKKLKTEDDQPDAGTAIPLSKMVRAQGLPPPPPTPKAGISLSGLLNAIDGVSSSEGRILIMTTNNPQDLDAALIRPGRVDQHVEFKLPHQPEMREMFLRMYRGLGEDKFATSTPSGVSSGEKVPSEEELSALATSFSTAFPEGRLSLASIQGYLLMHKRDPKAAVQDAAAWSERTLNEAAKDDTDSEEAPNVEEAKSGETGLQSN